MPDRTSSRTDDTTRAETTVGILFADIAGSTRLYEVLGDVRAHQVVADSLDLMAEAIAAQGGTLVKTIGDAAMGAFGTAPATFRAALDIRSRIAALPAIDHGRGHGLRIRVRIGLHFGPAISEAGDWFGDTVNVAARLSDLASAGQVLAAAEILTLLPPDLASLAQVFAEIEVKGREAPVRVARVAEPHEVQETTAVSFAARAPAPPPAEVQMALAFGGRNWTLPPGTRRVVLGREADCDIRLTGSLASRRHATIEIRRDKVVLIDHSSNGTWLTLSGDRPMRLTREEFGLIGHGTVTFGDPAAPDVDRLEFQIL